MSRKIKQLSIDGVAVDSSKARFADTFEVSQRDENDLAFDEEVVWVVVSRVSTPSFRETKGGEVSRVNVLKVREARLLRNESLQARVLEAIGFDNRPQKSLFDEDEDEVSPTPSSDLSDVVRTVVSSPDEDDELNVSGVDLDDYGREEDADERGSSWSDPEPEVLSDGSRRVKVPTAADNDPILANFLR